MKVKIGRDLVNDLLSANDALWELRLRARSGATIPSEWISSACKRVSAAETRLKKFIEDNIHD